MPKTCSTKMPPESLAASGSTSPSWRLALRLCGYQLAIVAFLYGWDIPKLENLATQIDGFLGISGYFAAHGFLALIVIVAILSRDWRAMLGGILIPTAISVWAILSFRFPLGHDPGLSLEIDEIVGWLSSGLLWGVWLAIAGWEFKKQAGEQGEPTPPFQFPLMSMFWLISWLGMWLSFLARHSSYRLVILSTFSSIPMLSGIAVLPRIRRMSRRLMTAAALCIVFSLVCLQGLWNELGIAFVLFAVQMLPGFFFAWRGMRLVPSQKISRETSPPPSPFAVD